MNGKGGGDGGTSIWGLEQKKRREEAGRRGEMGERENGREAQNGKEGLGGKEGSWWLQLRIHPVNSNIPPFYLLFKGGS